MSGRRNHSRFAVVSEGVLRVILDVDVPSGTGQDLIVISTDAVIPGDVMTIEYIDRAGTTGQVRVVESRPVMVSGSMRHEVRLRPLDEDGREPAE